MSLTAADYHSVEADEVFQDRSIGVSEGSKSGHYGYLVLEGGLFIKSSAGRVRIAPGQLGWVGAGMLREIRCEDASRWIVVRVRNRSFSPASGADQLAWRILLRLGAFCRTSARVPLSEAAWQTLRGIAGEMVDLERGGGPLSVPLRKAAALRFLGAMASDEPMRTALGDLDSSPSREDVVYQAIALIEREATVIRDVHDLARRCGLSRSRLYRAFAEASLPPPAVVLEHARLDHAGRLLRETDRTILHIAMESGFGSLSGFYRAFQRAHRTSPARWRSG